MAGQFFPKQAGIGMPSWTKPPITGKKPSLLAGKVGPLGGMMEPASGSRLTPENVKTNLGPIAMNPFIKGETQTQPTSSGSSSSSGGGGGLMGAIASAADSLSEKVGETQTQSGSAEEVAPSTPAGEEKKDEWDLDQFYQDILGAHDASWEGRQGEVDRYAAAQQRMYGNMAGMTGSLGSAYLGASRQAGAQGMQELERQRNEWEEQRRRLQLDWSDRKFQDMKFDKEADLTIFLQELADAGALDRSVIEAMLSNDLMTPEELESYLNSMGIDESQLE